MHVYDLPHAAPRIPKVVLGAVRHILRDPTCAIQASICPVLQHLGQACVQVHRIVGRLAVRCFAQAVSEAIILITYCNSHTTHTNQPVGAVVGVRIHAIIEQVAVVVPGVVQAVIIDQPV
jgi:hypothetical protein